VQAASDDVALRLPIRFMPAPVERTSHPKYVTNKKSPMCKHCWNVLAKSEGSSNSPVVCLGCDVSLCRRHWMQFPPHAAFYKTHDIKVMENEGTINLGAKLYLMLYLTKYRTNAIA